MKKITIAFIFLIAWVNGPGQNKFSNEFVEKWKADSLGTNGFRKTNTKWDSIQKTYLINGLNVLRFKKTEITQLLGKPNFSGTSEQDIIVAGGLRWTKGYTRVRQTINYTLYRCTQGEINMPGCITLEFRRNKVARVSVLEPCKFFKN